MPHRAPPRRRDLALALIVTRLLDPAAKRATARRLDRATAGHSLSETLTLGRVTARALYATLDWLGSQQSVIENRRARRHLKDAARVLYDVTSTDPRDAAVGWRATATAATVAVIGRNW